MLAAYILIKLILYTLVCSAAVPMLKLNVKDKWSFGIQWGVVRFLLGLVAGVLIVMILAGISKATDSAFIGYIFSFGFIRYFEWLFLAYLISRKHKIAFGKPTQVWILLGVLVSMLMDGIVYHFDMLDNMKFVC